MLKGKKVVVGVCGSISAHLAVDVVKWLVIQNADVQVIMTPNAKKFVTPFTFQVCSHNVVAIDDYEIGDDWHIAHLDVVKDADLVLVFPCTANTMGKVCAGIDDNVLTSAILAATCPVYFAPSMNTNMYENKTTQRNMKELENLGYHVIESDEGDLMCGAHGRGKVHTAQCIEDYIASIFEA